MPDLSSWRAAQRWTTSGRLRSLVLVCWGILLIVSLTAVGSLVVQTENIRMLTLVRVPALDANRQVLQAMTDAQTGLTAYQLSRDRMLLQPYFGAHERAMDSLATLDDKLTLGEEGDRDAAAQHNSLGDTQRLAAEKWWVNALYVEHALSNGERTDAFQGRALFGAFREANATLDQHLLSERDDLRVAARSLASRATAATIGAALLALVAMLVLGRRFARSISEPLADLRDTVVRQRAGDVLARAREDWGSSETRSLATSFNELTEQNLALLKSQASALGTNQITARIGREIRSASDAHQVLEVMCAALGEGLGADRVIGDSLGDGQTLLLRAQWQQPDLAPIGDLTMLPDPGPVAEQMWLANESRTEDDLLVAELQSQEAVRAFCRVSGARASITVPIGLGDRVIGMIYVLMVDGPRAWDTSEGTSETEVVKVVAGFVARALLGVETQIHEREYVERVERLDRHKTDFLSTVSHELRTPLTSITGYLELLEEGDAGELTAPQSRMLEVIGRNTARLRGLIEDVMMLNRIEGGVTEAIFAQVWIRGLITHVAEELLPLAATGGIELEIDAGPSTAIVVGDRSSLDRALVNILSNAIKFSHRGGVVTITGLEDHHTGRVLIICQDRGLGIPEHDLADLFTRFFRASNATDQSIPGTGLGLSIAKQIIEDHHGGELRLISVEGEGTTVVIDLPLHRPSGPAGTQQSPQTLRNGSHPVDVFQISE